MSENRLLVLGAGGHGKAVAEAALLSGQWASVAFVDDCWPLKTESAGIPIIANMTELSAVSGSAAGAIAAVGNSALREKWHQAIRDADLPLVTVIHPSAVVSPRAMVGAGCAIMALAMVGVDASVGEGVIINANATVDHDAEAGDFAHLGVGVQLAGGVRVGARSWLQAGCSAGYNVVVPDGSVIGPGTALSA